MRYIFIGDIHGCIDELQELVAMTKESPEDRVVCVGDFMDKGPDPAACVRFARENGFLSVRGNHEDKHLRWRQHERKARENPRYKNPMQPLGEEYLRQNAALSDEDVRWLEGLPFAMEIIPGVVVVHGGLMPHVALADQSPDKIQRLRFLDATDNYKPLKMTYETETPSLPPGAVHWTSVYDGPCDVVYGHEAHSLSRPRVDTSPSGASCYGIDTGCVHGGRLTALIMEPNPGWQRPYKVTTAQVASRTLYRKPRWSIPA